MKFAKFVVGIDEVGRGPLAGPVSVCLVGCTTLNYKKLKSYRELPVYGKDSKKIEPDERRRYSKILKSLTKDGKIFYKITHISNTTIDSRGISFSLKKAIKSLVRKSELDPKETLVLLDGGLRFPKEFKNQKTIIRGDEKEKIIAWASILAKVSRDALMTRRAKEFPKYGFESHKGYGTKEHKKAISKFGVSAFHRATFCNI